MATSFWNGGTLAATMSELGVGDALRPRAVPTPRLVALDGRLATQHGLHIEELSLEQLDAAQAEWSALAARAIEPNVFFAPGFALSAARHFPMRNRPRFVVVWDTRSAPRRMAGLFPVLSSGILGDRLIRMWLHKQATLATPLVDRDGAEETLAAFIDWIEARSSASGIVFGQILSDGLFHDVLRRVATRVDRATSVLERSRRAALFAGATAETVVARAGSKERLSQLRRQRRRLEQMGRVTLEEDALPHDVRRAAEEFLALEASGWKAGRGALLSQPSLATFFRSATRLLAREELCRIVSLRLDGRPLAMMVVLESQGHGFYWKTAFDEAFRGQAPGVQLFFEQSRAQLARPEIAMTDSCAAPDHPLIDRLWSDRITIADVAVQLQRGHGRDFQSSCRSDQRRRNVRDFAKRAARHMLRRKFM
jgi:CelD/BcsL family acetyltransferase involved in cellulose biosynthesis